MLGMSVEFQHIVELGPVYVHSSAASTLHIRMLLQFEEVIQNKGHRTGWKQCGVTLCLIFGRTKCKEESTDMRFTRQCTDLRGPNGCLFLFVCFQGSLLHPRDTKAIL